MNFAGPNLTSNSFEFVHEIHIIQLQITALDITGSGAVLSRI